MISRENLHNEEQIRRDIAAAFGAGARLIDTLGTVSVVGAGINASYANVRRGTTALRESAIAPEAMATSSFRITWLVPRASLNDAVSTLHRTFIGC